MPRREVLRGLLGAPPLFDDDAWLGALGSRAHHARPVAPGAAAEAGRGDVTFPITGFWNGMSFTKRSVQLA